MSIERPAQPEEFIPSDWDASRFGAILNNLRQVAFETDAQGVTTYLNPAWTEITGFTAEESLGRPFLDFILPEDREAHGNRFWQLIEGRQKSWSHEVRCLTRAGGFRCVDVHVGAVREDDGRIHRISGTLTDITGRKQAHAHLEAAGERLKARLGSTPAVLYAAAAEGDYPTLYVSENAPAILGYEPGYFLEDPQAWLSCIHPDDLHIVLGAFSALRGRQSASVLHRFRHASGNDLWVRNDMRLIRCQNGRSETVLGCLVDGTGVEEAGHALGRVSLNHKLRDEIAERTLMQRALAESEPHYRALIENIVEAVLLVDEQGRITYASPSLKRLFGHEPAEVEGHALTDYVREIERRDVRDLLRAAAERPGTHGPLGFGFFSASGECRLVRLRANSQLANPAVHSLIVTLSDITDLQRAEQEVRENEERYRSLFQASNDGILLTGGDRRVLDCNLSACRIFGYSREQMVGLTLDDLKGDESLGELGPWSAANLQKGNASEGLGKANDGRVFPVEVRGRSIKPQGERIVIAFVQDMTERKAAEQNLRESEQRYRAFLEQSTDAIWRIDFAEPIPVDLPESEQIDRMYAGGYIAECNDSMARLHGSSVASEMLGARLEAFFVPSDPANTARLLRLVRSGYRVTDDESYEPDQDGRIHYFVNNFVGFVDNGKLQRLWGTQRDVTERKAADLRVRAAQNALRESESLYRSLVETSPDAILLLDPGHTIRVLNPQAVKMLGFRDNVAGVGRSLIDLVPKHGRGRLARIMCGQKNGRYGVSNLETELTRVSGATFPADISASMLTGEHGECTGILAVIRDVTDRKQAEEARKQLEEQFRHAQKMEAVGRLAGGVAHDFNNLLTVITGYCELLLRRVDPASPSRRNLAQIKKAADRAAALVQHLLAFSRKQMIEPKVLDANVAIAELEKMLRRLIGEDIELITHLDSSPAWIKVDPGQLEQMVMNLTVNARDALPGGGTITVETGRVEIGCAGPGNRQLRPGTYLTLSVGDTGTGITEEVRSKIFEPFFTTKEQGKGTGLGLSTVYGIVKQGGGSISVESEPGKGTEFRILLPLVEPDVPTEEQDDETSLTAASEVILLVEDEELVREMARVTLEDCGYSVLEAANGEQALQVAERFANRIDMLLTDVVMPRMSGLDLATALGPLRPETKVLFMSGYADKDLGSLSPLLKKPFTPDGLARRVQEVLKPRTNHSV